MKRERSAKSRRTPKSSVRHLRPSSPRVLSKILADHLKALNQRDLDRLMTFYGDDAVLVFPASPPVEGKANIRRAYASFFENWEETSTYGVVIMSGATAAVEGTVTGRHRTLHLRIPGRIPAPSRAYRHNFAMFVELEGGQIRRQRVYFDARDLVKQILGDV